MAHINPFHHEDNIFGDVGGVVTDALKRELATDRLLDDTQGLEKEFLGRVDVVISEALGRRALRGMRVRRNKQHTGG
jgi:hypothetical protein